MGVNSFVWSVDPFLLLRSQTVKLSHVIIPRNYYATVAINWKMKLENSEHTVATAVIETSTFNCK